MSFVPNRGLADELADSPEMRRALVQAGREIAREAAKIARSEGGPWMERADADRVIIVDDDGDTVEVVNTDHGGHLLEWGSKNNPPHAPLRRGVRAAGYELDEH